MKRIVYKVCYDWGAGPQSFSIMPGDAFGGERRRGGVRYGLNEKVKPVIEGAPLMAFGTEEEAVFFAPDSFTIRVFRAEAKISKVPLPPKLFNFVVSYSSIKNFWKEWKDFEAVDPEGVVTIPPPKGTVLCDWIMLLEEIKRGH